MHDEPSAPRSSLPAECTEFSSVQPPPNDTDEVATDAAETQLEGKPTCQDGSSPTLDSSARGMPGAAVDTAVQHFERKNELKLEWSAKDETVAAALPTADKAAVVRDDAIQIGPEAPQTEVIASLLGGASDEVPVQLLSLAPTAVAEQANPTPSYRPRLVRATSTQPRPRTTRRARTAAVAREAELLLAFQPGGWDIDLSILLRCPEAVSGSVAVLAGGSRFELSAIDEELLEALPLGAVAPTAKALEHGFSIVAAPPVRQSWMRTARWLHVLSERQGVPGYATVPRIGIGHENVVLCLASHADEALSQIRATGSPDPRAVKGPGVPEGWMCWRGVFPAHPAEPSGADPMLQALNPQPDAAVVLAGGISIARGCWAEGRPPSIHLIGSLPPGAAVTIDGRPATVDAGGAWTAPGWDDPGYHAVTCGGLTRTYTIEPAPEDWPWWPAAAGQVSVAGALALDAQRRPLLMLSAPPFVVVLGARPGEVCRLRRLELGNACAATNFQPVWALSEPTGRRRPAPCLIGPALPPKHLDRRLAAESTAADAWSRLIRNTGVWRGSRDAPEARLWASYLAAARAIRVRRR